MSLNGMLDSIVNVFYRQSSPMLDALEEQAKQDDEFMRILKQFDDSQETEAERAKRKANEAEAAQERERLRKRINELHSMIAKLRQRVAAAGDKTSAAQLSAAQTELFWLMFGL